MTSPETENQGTTNDQSGATPDATTAGAPAAGPAAGSASAPRRPQYGELAPEGWSWSPEGEDRETPASAPVSPAPAIPVVTSQTPNRLPGVPHNLGARGETSNTPRPGGAAPGERPASSGGGAPYRDAATPERREQPGPADPPSATAAQPVARAPRVGDRVITVVLLVLGAYGALNFAASLQQLSAQFTSIGSTLSIDNFVVPDSVQTLGTVGAVVVLALYAVNVILSIQRMRANRLAFWVPLVTAVIAFIVAFAFVAFGLNQVPELMSKLTEPDSLQMLLDSIGR